MTSLHIADNIQGNNTDTRRKCDQQASCNSRNLILYGTALNKDDIK